LLYTSTAVVIGQTCLILPIIMNMSGRIQAWTGIGRDFFAAGFPVESVPSIAENADLTRLSLSAIRARI
jgi:hypothetical protein